jgi:hypothetical protein
LFNTIGKVERAEIQYEPSGRSRGTGVVMFDCAENAEISIGRNCFYLDRYIFNANFVCFFVFLKKTAKFSGYLYGGRPLGLSYVRYTTFGGDGMDGTDATVPEHHMG